jgi:hypothetical protein
MRALDGDMPEGGQRRERRNTEEERHETTIRAVARRYPPGHDGMCWDVRTSTANAKRWSYWRCRRRRNGRCNWGKPSSRCWRRWCRRGSYWLFLGSALWEVGRARTGMTSNVGASTLSGESEGLPREALRVEGCPWAEPSRSHKPPLTMRQEQGSKDFRRCSKRRRRLLASEAAITIHVKSNLLADSVVAALVIEADTTDRNEDRPTGKCRGAVFLGAAFFARSSPFGGRLFNFAFDLPLHWGRRTH